MPVFDKVISDMVTGKEGSTFEYPFFPFYPLSVLGARTYFAKPFTEKFFLGEKELNFTRVLFLIHN